MANEYEHSRGALSSQDHAHIDPRKIYQDILHLVPREGLLYDIGSGVGRDAVFMRQHGNSNTNVIAIDPDPERFYDAEKIYPASFSLIDSWNEMEKTHQAGKIPYVIGKLQNVSTIFNDKSVPQPGDFVLCNAVLMFVPSQEEQNFMNGLARLTKTGKQAVLRYRTEGLKNGMREINLRGFEKHVARAGFEIEQTKSVPDPRNRPFHWHQFILTRR